MRLGLISTTKFRLLKTFTTSFFFFFLLEKVINRVYVIPTLTKNVTIDCIWRIKYDDGTTIWEKNPDSGEETLFKDIDQDKIKEIDLVNPIKELDDLLKEEVKTHIRNKKGEVVELHFKTYHKEVVPIFHLELDEGQRLVLFRRQSKRTGQHVAVLGDPDMLDDEKRELYEKNQNTSVKKPETIAYPMERANDTVFLIGWQMTIGGKNIKSICMIYPDGRVEMKPDR